MSWYNLKSGIILNCPGRNYDRNLYRDKLRSQFLPGRFKIVPVQTNLSWEKLKL